MASREKAVDRVLRAAEQRFGLGTVDGPQWVRDRVESFLDAFAERMQIPWEAAAEEVVSRREPMNELVATLRVGETRFFRDAAQLEVAVRHACEHVPQAELISVLSAGCSTGEEAYTLAILLQEKGRRFRVVGVDRSEEAIRTARAGLYSAEAVREVPAALLVKHFDQQGAGYAVLPALRTLVSFDQRDLVKRPPRGRFDLIVFKNVLLYLAEPAGTQVAQRLAQSLKENGIFVSAAAEVVRLSAILDACHLARGVIAFRAR